MDFEKLVDSEIFNEQVDTIVQRLYNILGAFNSNRSFVQYMHKKIKTYCANYQIKSNNPELYKKIYNCLGEHYLNSYIRDSITMDDYETIKLFFNDYFSTNKIKLNSIIEKQLGPEYILKISNKEKLSGALSLLAHGDSFPLIDYIKNRETLKNAEIREIKLTLTYQFEYSTAKNIDFIYLSNELYDKMPNNKKNDFLNSLLHVDNLFYSLLNTEKEHLNTFLNNLEVQELLNTDKLFLLERLLKLQMKDADSFFYENTSIYTFICIANQKVLDKRQSMMENFSTIVSKIDTDLAQRFSTLLKTTIDGKGFGAFVNAVEYIIKNRDVLVHFSGENALYSDFNEYLNRYEQNIKETIIQNRKSDLENTLSVMNVGKKIKVKI